MIVPNDPTMDLFANSNAKVQTISYWEAGISNALQGFPIVWKKQSGEIQREVIRYHHVLQNLQVDFQTDS